MRQGDSIMTYNQPSGQFQQQYQVPFGYYEPVRYPPQQAFKGGFHPLYIWSIACLVLTYGYIALYVISTNFLRCFSGTENSALPMIFLCFPWFLTIANIIITATYGRKLDRRYLLGAALIIKYGLIPYFVIGGMAIALFFLLIFTPVVIMIFVSPPIIFVLSVIGWFTLTESIPFMVAYFIKAAKDGALSRNGMKTAACTVFAVFGCIMQMFFCLDVVAAVICCIKEKRHIKLTVCVFAVPAMLIGLFLGYVIITGLLGRA